MDKNFTISITTSDGTDCGDKLPVATYDQATNRVIWIGDKSLMDEKCLLLPNI